jgi:PAS domain S-box-containing protein
VNFDFGSSPELYRVLFDLSPDAVFFFVGGVVLHANPAAMRLLGAERLDQLVGRRSTAIVHPDSIPLVEQRAAALMSGAASVPTAEEKYVRLDGAVLDVESSAALVPMNELKAFVVIVSDIRERKEAEAERRRARDELAASLAAKDRERWLRELLDLMPICIFARDAKGVFLLANRAYAEGIGLPAHDIVGRSLRELPLTASAVKATLADDLEVLASGRVKHDPEQAGLDVARRKRILDVRKIPFNFAGIATVLGVGIDVTDRKQLEAQLVQAQKMEGIGRLAGGIAHDFNNLLTVVLGGAQQLDDRLGPDEDVHRIREAAERATALTRQLLSFARQSPVESRVVSINELVSGVARLLGRVLGEDVTLVTALDEDVKSVLIDPGQMDQVLMNLAVNARDAMPGGGTLTMATRNVDADGCAWIEVRVSDTGSGMSDATRSRMFEPFFTTKEVGKGTGLGLSTCYGIVQQLGGRIAVESAIGAGTTLRILLPACTAAREVTPSKPAPAAAVGGGETVLLLEDDRMVRTLTTRLLKLLGYQVLVAALPGEALALAREHPTTIDLLMTDVMMPEISGPQAAIAIRAIRPEIRVLYVSGYSADALPTIDEDTHFLGKPYTREELAEKIRHVLASPLPPPN